RQRGGYLFASEFFAEEVRRELVDMFGADKLYEGGLSVRATLDPDLQQLAREKLQAGLVKFDQARGFRGPYKTIDIGGDWGERLAQIPSLTDVPEWRLAVVLGVDDAEASIGLQPTR